MFVMPTTTPLIRAVDGIRLSGTGTYFYAGAIHMIVSLPIIRILGVTFMDAELQNAIPCSSNPLYIKAEAKNARQMRTGLVANIYCVGFTEAMFQSADWATSYAR